MLELEQTANKCEMAGDCKKCLQNPACGWCDGGVGYCVPGSASGPAEWYAPKMPDTPYGKCSTWQYIKCNCGASVGRAAAATPSRSAPARS